MPMIPNCQANPYVEPPSFILPHSHLHLMDYRRVLNPQYYQTMAYHSRRFRYQQSRETTSSEVQTEPLRTSTPTSGNVEVVASTTLPLAEVSAPQSDRPPDSTSNGSFLIQTEEVRIECCATPVGLQVLHSHEAAEVSRTYSQEAQRGANALHGPPLPLPPADQSDQQTLQVCPDILLVGSPASSESAMMAAEKGLPASDSNGAPLLAVQENASSPHNRFITLPFDANYLDELKRMESTVWSAEETLVASPELDRASESCVENLELRAADGTTVGEEMEVPAAEPEVGFGAANEAMSEADAAQDVLTTEETQSADVVEVPCLLLLDKSPTKELDQEQPRRETTVQDQQDTSFESLPAYLPSSSWLADFDHGQHPAQLPVAPQKDHTPSLLDPIARRRKLDLDYRELGVSSRKSKVQRYKPRGKAERRSLSDHECCLGRSYNENVPASCGGSRKERLCTRCLAKRHLRLVTSPGGAGPTARKPLPFQPLQSCSSCKCHPDTAKPGTSPGGSISQKHCGLDTEGESSENGGSSSCCRRLAKWRRVDDSRRLSDFNRPLASKQNLAALPPPPPPAAAYLRMREKSCMCSGRQLQQVAAWQRRSYCHHSNEIQELDENSGVPGAFLQKWRNRDHMYLTHRCHTGKCWMGHEL